MLFPFSFLKMRGQRCGVRLSVKIWRLMKTPTHTTCRWRSVANGGSVKRTAQVGTVPPEHMNWTPLLMSLPLTMLSAQKYGNSTPR